MNKDEIDRITKLELDIDNLFNRVAVLEERMLEKERTRGRVFTAGRKHNGRPMDVILANDPQYIVWCHDTISSDYGGITEEDYAAAQAAIKQQGKDRGEEKREGPPQPGRPAKPEGFDDMDDDIPF